MELKSVGLNSDLEILKITSNVIDKGNYLKIETPNNPEYYWGNFLVFSTPPKSENLNEWIATFKNEFGANQHIKHVAFTWDIYGGKPEIEAFLNAGFVLEETVHMTAQKMSIYKVNSDFEYRIITSHEWEKLIELQIEVGLEQANYNPKIYRDFVQKKFSNYKLMIDKNLGHWFGAFKNGQLVCDLGLFGDPKNLRFQSIETKKEFRNLGVAQNLMLFASNRLKSENYILQADSKGRAIDLYMKMGFEIKEVLSFLHTPST